MNNYSVLRFYASTTDKIHNELLYEYIVYEAKKQNISGVTVYRGVMGYGMSSKHVNTSRFWELVEKLPVVIEMVDKTEVLENFYKLIEPELQSMPKGCMVYMLPVNMKLMKKGKTS
jgi:PII-like signaling protein